MLPTVTHPSVLTFSRNTSPDSADFNPLALMMIWRQAADPRMAIMEASDTSVTLRGKNGMRVSITPNRITVNLPPAVSPRMALNAATKTITEHWNGLVFVTGQNPTLAVLAADKLEQAKVPVILDQPIPPTEMRAAERIIHQMRKAAQARYHNDEFEGWPVPRTQRFAFA